MTSTQHTPMDHQDESLMDTQQGDGAAQNNDGLLYDSFSETIGMPKTGSADPRIAALEEELKNAKDQTMRALADAENTRRRAQREREDAQKFAVSGFSRDLLSVADNLRRALESFPADAKETNPQIKNLIDGIEATERELLRSFDKNGIQKIIPMDLPFDPNFHEVMFETPVAGKVGGTVIQVIESGYTLNGRILRPARVGIAKADPSAPPHSDLGQKFDTQA